MMDRKIPTPEKPCRSVAPLGHLQGSVSGHYQAVVQMPAKSTKRDELLAFAEATESLAELARRWADDEAPDPTPSSPVSMRLTVSIHMRPEGDRKS